MVCNLPEARVKHALCAVAICVCAQPAPAVAGASSLEATVFIRIIGEIRVTSAGRDRLPGDAPELQQVEVGTGSGFVVSPFGYVVTNRHVVEGGEFTVTTGTGRRMQVTVDVRRIEVILPAGTSGAEPRRLTASVAATDPDLDLAVLYVGGTDLPYAPLGDSDAVRREEPVTAIGYPLGRVVELGKASREDLTPGVTVSSGTVSALRTSDRGDLRYIQTDAAVNPGNSGGPLVDREGYVQGIVQSRLNGANNIGFAIPVNLVKTFLVTNGLDQTLPVRLLALGPIYAPDMKGLRLRPLGGFEDLSASRLRVASADTSEAVALRIDRVPSLWGLEQLEQGLLQGNVFERFSAARISRQLTTPRVDGGSATGFAPGSQAELKMEYALINLGREKVVARYVGPAEQVAANRSVLRASLASLEAEPLLTAEIDRPVAVALQPVVPPTPDVPRVSVPADWSSAFDGPSGCFLPTSPDLAVSVSPSRDYTVSFKLGWWRAGTVTADLGAVKCPGGRDVATRSGYSARVAWLGADYVVEGRFVSMGERGIAQVEVVAPAGKIEFVRTLFAAWVKEATVP